MGISYLSRQLKAKENEPASSDLNLSGDNQFRRLMVNLSKLVTFGVCQLSSVVFNE